jgi:hypothetical protein
MRYAAAGAFFAFDAACAFRLVADTDASAWSRPVALVALVALLDPSATATCRRPGAARAAADRVQERSHQN